MARAGKNPSTKSPASDEARADPVVQAGIQLAAQEARYNEIDGRPTAIGSELVYRNAEMADLDRRTHVLRAYITIVKATSVAGAVVQLDQILSIVEASTMDGENKLTDEEQSHIVRMLFSINGVLIETLAPDVRASVRADHSNYMDPWTPYEKRLEIVAKRTAKRRAEAA